MTSSVVLDRTFDALANEHRRRIVNQLTAGPLDTPTLGSRFALSKQGLSRHLIVLQDAGLVERRLRGRVHQLSLQAAPLDGVSDWVTEVRRGWEANLDRLNQILREANDG